MPPSVACQEQMQNAALTYYEKWVLKFLCLDNNVHTSIFLFRNKDAIRKKNRERQVNKCAMKYCVLFSYNATKHINYQLKELVLVMIILHLPAWWVTHLLHHLHHHLMCYLATHNPLMCHLTTHSHCLILRTICSILAPTTLATPTLLPTQMAGFHPSTHLVLTWLTRFMAPWRTGLLL